MVKKSSQFQKYPPEKWDLALPGSNPEHRYPVLHVFSHLGTKKETISTPPKLYHSEIEGQETPYRLLSCFPILISSLLKNGEAEKGSY